jgi:predicted PurR-regulated permease PerM
MNKIEEQVDRLTPTTFLESMVRVGVVALLAIFCFRIAFPFLNLMVWAVMLAIMLYPLHQKLARKLGGKQGLASVLMVVVVALLVVPPLVLVIGSHVGEVKAFQTAYENGEVSVPTPSPEIRDWPVVGEKVFPLWENAARNLPAFLESHAAQLKALAAKAFALAGDLFGTVALFLAAFLVSGFMMAFAGQGTRAMARIFNTLAGPKRGPGFLDLVVGTVRSVATGVLGVAFIQSLLFGVGLVLAGVPAAGLLTIVVLFLAIIQVPATLVGLPVIIWLWVASDGSMVTNVLFSIFFLIASLSDNILKPMLLGRGLSVPMPVILIGALGGMISMGMLGLFFGAVVLAVGYEIFMGWTDQAELAMSDSDDPEAST